jgi:diaminopimelate decarboxylase
MHSTISTRHQSLFIEDIALADIANQFGTPCYVYSKEAITQNFNAYESALRERNLGQFRCGF